MARIRSLKPELPQSESMGRVSRDARLLFIQLWTIADDSGRARGNSRMLASLLFPYDDDAPHLIDGWLDELEREGCIRRYVVDGQKYLDIPNWLKHQKIEKPSQSKLPPFTEASPTPPRIVAEPSVTPHPRKGKEGKGVGEDGKGKGPGPLAAAEPRPGEPAVEAWNAYALAYQKRWGVAPIRNAKVNGMFANFLKRIPHAEAAEVAEFYVGHHRHDYVRSKHDVSLLLRDAEGLRTEWATGRRVTDAEARQADKTAGNMEQVNRLLQEVQH